MLFYLCDSFDFYFRVRLAVAVSLQVSAFLFVLYHHHFVGAAGIFKCSLNFCSIDKWRADSCIFAIVYEKDFVENDCVAFFELISEFFNSNNVSDRDFVLLSACLYNCKFHTAIVAEWLRKVNKAAYSLSLRDFWPILGV